MGRVTPEGPPDCLSGILIGGEIASGCAAMKPAQSAAAVVLIGDDDLCDRHARALQLRGMAGRRAPPGIATAGQWRIALAAGLVRAR